MVTATSKKPRRSALPSFIWLWVDPCNARCCVSWLCSPLITQARVLATHVSISFGGRGGHCQAGLCQVVCLSPFQTTEFVRPILSFFLSSFLPTCLPSILPSCLSFFLSFILSLICFFLSLRSVPFSFFAFGFSWFYLLFAFLSLCFFTFIISCSFLFCFLSCLERNNTNTNKTKHKSNSLFGSPCLCSCIFPFFSPFCLVLISFQSYLTVLFSFPNYYLLFSSLLVFPVLSVPSVLLFLSFLQFLQFFSSFGSLVFPLRVPRPRRGWPPCCKPRRKSYCTAGARRLRPFSAPENTQNQETKQPRNHRCEGVVLGHVSKFVLCY